MHFTSQKLSLLGILLVRVRFKWIQARSNLLLNSLNLPVLCIFATTITGLSIIVHGIHPYLLIYYVKTRHRYGEQHSRTLFSAFKWALSQALSLWIPDFEMPFTFVTDAYDVAISIVLTKEK